MSKKISDLTAATTPVVGDELIEIVQDGASKKVAASYLYRLEINTQTASYTLVFSDAEKYIRMNVGSANNLTVPANASVAFPVGTQIHVRQVGTGQVTLVADSGVTITTAETLKIRVQHSTVSLVKVGTDIWDLMGDLEAA